jgi:hypothetical protein
MFRASLSSHVNGVYVVVVFPAGFITFATIPSVVGVPFFVGIPVVAFIPGVACVPAVVGSHVIAVILAVACRLHHCRCFSHC